MVPRVLDNSLYELHTFRQNRQKIGKLNSFGFKTTVRGLPTKKIFIPHKTPLKSVNLLRFKSGWLLDLELHAIPD